MAYTELRKFLINDGYLKIQPEVFMRVEDTKKSCIKHQNRIKLYLPSTGEVRMLILTEKQYKNCLLCHDKPRYILDLLLSVINVSVQTVDIVNNLPEVDWDKE